MVANAWLLVVLGASIIRKAFGSISTEFEYKLKAPSLHVTLPDAKLLLTAVLFSMLTVLEKLVFDVLDICDDFFSDWSIYDVTKFYDYFFRHQMFFYSLYVSHFYCWLNQLQQFHCY